MAEANHSISRHTPLTIAQHIAMATMTRAMQLFGEVQEDGSFLPIPKQTEVPRYTENTDDAVDLKNKIIRYQRRVLIEEVEDEHISRWRAKIIDGSKQIVGEGETYSCGASVVLAILSDLIANDCASWWIEVVDEK